MIFHYQALCSIDCCRNLLSDRPQLGILGQNRLIDKDCQKSHKDDHNHQSQQRHEAWTVGLAEPTLHGSTGGGLQVFINLQDNTEFSKHNVCIGKVFDGFDVLHKMVEQSRQMQQAAGGGQAHPHVRWRRRC